MNFNHRGQRSETYWRAKCIIKCLPGLLRPLRWRATHAEPIDFAASAVNAAHWPMPKNPPKPTGAYCFDTAEFIRVRGIVNFGGT